MSKKRIYIKAAQPRIDDILMQGDIVEWRGLPPKYGGDLGPNETAQIINLFHYGNAHQARADLEILSSPTRTKGTQFSDHTANLDRQVGPRTFQEFVTEQEAKKGVAPVALLDVLFMAKAYVAKAAADGMRCAYPPAKALERIESVLESYEKGEL